MAANFRMTQSRRKNSLHLKLSGDFDGSSAMELVHMLEEITGEAQKIYIETDNSCSIRPFGRDVFLKNFSISAWSSKKFIFMGNQSGQIAPRGVYCINNNQAC